MNKFTGTYNADNVTLENITITNASINNTNNLTALPNNYGIEVSFQLRPGVNISHTKVKIDFICDIKITENGTSGGEIGVNSHFEVAFWFNVTNLSELAIENSEIPEESEISDELLAGLANIVYATSRGIIYSRCLGTILGKMILPVLPTNKVLGKVN